MFPQFRNNFCVQQNLPGSQNAQGKVTCVLLSLCNRSAWQVPKPGWRQCSHRLLLGSPTYCKTEAASVLTTGWGLGITTERPEYGHSGNHEPMSPSWGQGREQLRATDIKRVCVKDRSRTHRPLCSHICIGVIITTTH